MSTEKSSMPAWLSSTPKHTGYKDREKANSSSSSNSNTSNTSSSSSGGSGSSYKAKGTYRDSGVSSEDKQALSAYGEAYAAAQATGDTKGMEDAHAGAESIRSKYGYSGGTDGSDYISLGKENNNIIYNSNPYNSYKQNLDDKYAELNEAIEEKNRLAVEQGVNRLNAQKNNINQTAKDNARQAYIMYMQNKKALPQQLASQGVSGGATETANLGINTTYQNNIAEINKTKANALQEIDNAIADLQTTGDLSTVEQVLANNQQALSAYQQAFAQEQAYNQWANEFNANRSDAEWNQNYQEQAYKDSMTQQELENSWYERNYSDSKKQEETNRIITMLQNGLVDVEYASSLLGVPANQINDFVNYINKTRSLSLQSQQADINNTNSLMNSRNKEKEEETEGNNYYNLASQINKMYANNATGKTAGEAVIVDDGAGGYMINPDISRGSYLDLIVARAFDSNMSDTQVKTFLNNLGIDDTEISRVAAYYLK